jgi:predicted Zn-dependent peptidase
MPEIATQTLDNGLPVHRVALDGTRAVTLLVAFDAGARTERPEENGMAHFLSTSCSRAAKFPTTGTSTRPPSASARCNAFTSHDIVAFHITARGRARNRRPAHRLRGAARIDADELDRERGVVIRRSRAPTTSRRVLAEHLIDEAAFGDHPLGRPVLGPENTCAFTRDAIVAFRERRWSGQRAGAFLVGNLDALPTTAPWPALRPLPHLPEPPRTTRRRRSRPRPRSSIFSTQAVAPA